MVRFNIVPDGGPPPSKGAGLLAAFALLTAGAIVALVGSRLGWG
jgi:hypothetical protein